MVIAVGVTLGVVLVVLAAVSLSYNRFVQQRQACVNAWSNVDTELRRRYDLIPNLVETVRGYATHEQRTLEAVIRARGAALASSGPADEQAGAENVLAGALRQLLAVSEAYPNLKASPHFLALQNELVVTEDRISAARRLYNANVRDYNERVLTIPTNLVAKLGGFRLEPYFEIEPVVRTTVPGTHFAG